MNGVFNDSIGTVVLMKDDNFKLMFNEMFNKNNKHYKVQNVTISYEGVCYLIHGWHTYREPMNLKNKWTAQIINEHECRLIREVE